MLIRVFLPEYFYYFNVNYFKMKNITLLIFVILVFVSNLPARSVEINLTNETGLDIAKVEYWIGSLDGSFNPNLVYLAKGPLYSDRNRRKKSFLETFNKRSRSQLVIKVTFTVGGFFKIRYSVGPKQKVVNLPIISPAQKLEESSIEKVLADLNEKGISNSEMLSVKNTLNSLLGSIQIYLGDSLIDQILPRELGSQMNVIEYIQNEESVKATLSESSVIKANITLPFFSTNTAFETGKGVKYEWVISNKGPINWSDPQGDNLPTLLSKLDEDRLKALFYMYEQYDSLNLRFIYQIEAIEKIEVKAKRSSQILRDTEITGSNFVTANAFYSFKDDFESLKTYEDIAYNAKSYSCEHLLINLYWINRDKISKEEIMEMTELNDERIRETYKYFHNTYPTIFPPINSREIENNVNQMEIYLTEKMAEVSLQPFLNETPAEPITVDQLIEIETNIIRENPSKNE